MPSANDIEAELGIPVRVLDAMDEASVARVLSEPRWLEAYAALVAHRAESTGSGPLFTRAAELLSAAVAAGHAQPQRLRALIDAMRSRGAAEHGR